MLATVWFCLVAITIIGYVLLDGFDLGAGILQLFVSRTEADRGQVLRSIGPVWDGNEVWLVVVGGILFLSFPVLYAAAFSGFYLALMIVLWLLILRGVAIEFRSHVDSPQWEEFWSVVFGLASSVLALVFGIALGNVIRGVPLDQTGHFFLPLWTSFSPTGEVGIVDWYTLLVGVASVLTLAVHGSLWVVVHTGDGLQARAHSFAARCWTALVPIILLLSAASFYLQPNLVRQFRSHPWGAIFPSLAIAGMTGAAVLSGRRRDGQAFWASGLGIAGMIGSAAFGVFPNVLPSNAKPELGLTIYNAAAADHGLFVGLWWFIPGMALAVGYTVLVYRRFAGSAASGHDVSVGSRFMSKPWKVVIIGGGFGGLCAAQNLKSDLVDITLVDRRNYHLFQPLLYQVATGSLSPGEVAAPLRGILSGQKNTRVLLGTVVDVDPQSKRVFLEDGAILPYDSLIVAAGSETCYFGHNEWREWAPGLKSVEEATAIRHKILYAFEVAERISDPAQRRAWLTFVMVGAGPTGVEMAGAIAEIARQTLKNDFRSIHPEDAEIILLDGAPRVLMSFPEDLAEKATHALTKLGVKVKCRSMVQHVDNDGLTIESGGRTDSIAAKTVIWAGGITASPLGKILATRTKAETDKRGSVKVRPDLTVPNYPDIYVIGDLASASDERGRPLPGLAQVAMQGGTYAGKAILRRANGQPELAQFRYFDKGTLAVIGRAAAVADVFGMHMSGFPAWLVWALVHLMYLVTFQSRLLVFVQWAIQDLTFSRGSRLITGIVPTDFNFDKKVSHLRIAAGLETEPVPGPSGTQRVLSHEPEPKTRMRRLGLIAVALLLAAARLARLGYHHRE
jgi:NADH:ubiquinone reductase (H+-translocating)